MLPWRQSDTQSLLCSSSVVMDVLHAPPIMRHLISKLALQDLANLAATCRTAAALISGEDQFLARTMEQALHASQANLAEDKFNCRTWSSGVITIPSPDCIKYLQVTSVRTPSGSASLNLIIQGGPARGVALGQGQQLLGLPCWSRDGTAVAVAVSWYDLSDIVLSTSSIEMQSAVVIWDVIADTTRSVTGFGSGPAPDDRVGMHWAPASSLGHQLVITLREALEDRSCRHNFLLIGAHGECKHLQSSDAVLDGCQTCELISWSPDSSQVALAFGCNLYIAFFDSQAFWESAAGLPTASKDVAAACRPITWAPSGSWILCQSCFVRPMPRGEKMLPCADHGASDILADCTALTWGSSGVVAATTGHVYVFKVVKGPDLVQLHKVELAAGHSVHSPALHLAPDDSGWVACLIQLDTNANKGALQLLMLDLDCGYAHRIPVRAGGGQDDYFAVMLANAATLQTACVWAPDGCSIWVGVLEMQYERLKQAPDTFEGWLLRFTQDREIEAQESR